jgi:hypothetical protein
MSEFCTRALAMLLTAAVFMIVIPVGLKLLFTIGPFGFILLVGGVLAAGAIFLD